jgi:ribonuclease J
MSKSDYEIASRPDNEDYLRFIPLGGLDEVGMNCALMECNGSMLMVDCGYTFPESDSYGVDYILPDWSYVMDNLDRLDGILLTHGHQDHIGALPYFLKEVDVPLYSGEFTLKMVESQLKEHHLHDKVDMFPIATDELLEIGPFQIEFIHVNHSVPNARSISLNTPVGRYIFTGDWKMDQMPLYEPVLDMQTFADFGRDGVRAVFGDSTNAESEGFSTSEYEVYEGISNVADDTEGRLIVAQFSSNLHRLDNLLDLAHRHDRKVLLMGRSIRDNVELAIEEGYLNLPDENITIKPHQLDNYNDDQVMIICTGSQAEPRAAMTRMAYGDHHTVTLTEDDTVVLSARVIPGNERGIQQMLDELTRRGASVVTAKQAPIHGSGHAKRDELKILLNLTQPDSLVPVHGHYRMRQKHAELAEEVGVPYQHVIENGDVLQFTEDDTRVVGSLNPGRVLVDGANVGDLESVALRDRAKLADAGIIVAFVVMDKSAGELEAKPELIQRGLMGAESDTDIEDMLERAADAAEQGILQLSDNARRDFNEVDDAIQRSVRKFFRRRIDRKPVVIPVIHEL